MESNIFYTCLVLVFIFLNQLYEYIVYVEQNAQILNVYSSMNFPEIERFHNHPKFILSLLLSIFPKPLPQAVL